MVTHIHPPGPAVTVHIGAEPAGRLLASLPEAEPGPLQDRALLASRVAFDMLAGNMPVAMSTDQLCDFLASGIVGGSKQE